VKGRIAPSKTIRLLNLKIVLRSLFKMIFFQAANSAPPAQDMRRRKARVSVWCECEERIRRRKPKTIPVFSLWSLAFGMIFIPVETIEPKTNRQRPKTFFSVKVQAS
jgi:hypothetical protein